MRWDGAGISTRQGNKESVQILRRDALALLDQARAKQVPGQLMSSMGVIDHTEETTNKHSALNCVHIHVSYLSQITEKAVLM